MPPTAPDHAFRDRLRRTRGPGSRALPTGTVTFLFTDIEGSTKQLQALGDEAYAVALAEHRAFLREALATHGGVEVDTQGDAFFAAFPTAEGAVEAASEIQRRLAPGRIHVRIGVHTGTPVVTNEGYVGEDVHRAARIAAAGHGGQILLSAVTATLLNHRGDALCDLGEHRLKDLGRAERIYQLGMTAFPRLRSLAPSNLPAETTPFIGRTEDVRAVRALLTDHATRLVSLVGPGGTGKTRLAMVAAAQASDEFPDGLWWVPLATLGDPTLVLPAIAASAGVELPRERIGPSLGEALAERRALILLDNAEHLLPGLADEVAPLIARASKVRFLVTSREPLHLSAERQWQVPSMNPNDAITLFRSRAQAVGVELAPSDTVSSICERLDRLPLALQLVAPRLKLLSVSQVLDRLDSTLDLTGPRDADPRQRTLRATIEWSYSLLDDREQTLLRRLAVFVGGASLEAVEHACAGGLDTLSSLVDKSLVRRRDTEDGARFWMLATIREFALEKLNDGSELDEARRAYATWFQTYVALWGAALRDDPSQARGFDQLDIELDNIRQALTWADERGEDNALQRLAADLVAYWIRRGLFGEARQWVERAAARPASDVSLRVLVLSALVKLRYYCGVRGNELAPAEEAVRLAQSLGRDDLLESALAVLGLYYGSAGRIDDMIEVNDRVVANARRSGNADRLARALIDRADSSLITHQYEAARAYALEVLEMSKATGVNAYYEIYARGNLAIASYQLGETADVIEHTRKCLSHGRGVMATGKVIFLMLLAGVRGRMGDRVAAGRLFGASVAVAKRFAYELEPAERELYETVGGEIGLDSSEVRAAFEEGRAMGVDDSVALLMRTMESLG